MGNTNFKFFLTLVREIYMHILFVRENHKVSFQIVIVWEIQIWNFVWHWSGIFICKFSLSGNIIRFPLKLSYYGKYKFETLSDISQGNLNANSLCQGKSEDFLSNCHTMGNTNLKFYLTLVREIYMQILFVRENHKVFFQIVMLWEIQIWNFIWH